MIQIARSLAEDTQARFKAPIILVALGYVCTKSHCFLLFIVTLAEWRSAFYMWKGKQQ